MLERKKSYNFFTMGTEAFGDAVSHWRLRKQRLSLLGDYDPETNSVAFPPGPHRPRFPLNENDSKEENSLEDNIIYQVPMNS